MIAAATEVYMTLWNGKPEKVIVLTPLQDGDGIYLSMCKRFAVVSDGAPSVQCGTENQPAALDSQTPPTP